MNIMATELDHLFFFVEDELTARRMMAEAGLRVNYSRKHPGQGTTNLCSCLDEMFLELLWLDGSEISAESERIGIGRRGRGEGSPIGISWRGKAAIETEPYMAPYLPDGVSIPVALASRETAVPLVFQSPGGTKPIDRTDGLVGTLQRPELTALGRCTVFVSEPDAVAELLVEFDEIEVREGAPAIEVELLNADNQAARNIRWAASESA